MTSLAPEGADEVLDLLREVRGYAPAPGERERLSATLRARMSALDLSHPSEYRKALLEDPGEIDRLLEAMLGRSPCLFGDAPFWEHLRHAVLPRLLAARDDDAPLRIWCAGCATGEEAYSLAVLLVEALGPEAFRRRVRIYATDVREKAIGIARRGVHAAEALVGLPPGALASCFERLGSNHAFRPELRRCLVFGRHDLVNDAPISRLDLICCRDVLLWMESTRRWQAVARLAFALNDGGLLVLGRCEELQSHRELLLPLDPGYPIFEKVAGRSAEPTLGAGVRATGGDRRRTLLAAALHASPVAQLVVRPDGELVLASARAQALFGIQPVDIGRLLSELAVFRSPTALGELLDGALGSGSEVVRAAVAHRLPDGSPGAFDVHVLPLGAGGDPLGACITFVDRSAERRLQRELSAVRRTRERGHEEAS